MPFEVPEKDKEVEANRRALGRKALAAIAAHVLKVPRGQFDMTSWRDTYERKALGFLPLKVCQTVGCAIGSSYKLPAVRATGLYAGQSGFPYFGNHGGFAAVAVAFGIAEVDAQLLFHPDKYTSPTREAVSSRIRFYLNSTEDK